MPLGLALLMTACSNFQALESEPVTQISVIEEDQIVETLVSAAGDFGEADIDGLQREPVTEEEAVFQAEPTEPVTPTINMTANRVVERAINDHLAESPDTAEDLDRKKPYLFPDDRGNFRRGRSSLMN